MKDKNATDKQSKKGPSSIRGKYFTNIYTKFGMNDFIPCFIKSGALYEDICAGVERSAVSYNR